MSPRDEASSVEEILARVPLFLRLEPRDLKKLAKLCVRRRFAAGELVIAEGAVGLGMFVLTRGRVEVFKGSGAERLRLGETVAGEVLGEIALIDDQPRSASAIATEPTECLLLTKERFERLVRKEPEIAWCIVPSLTDRIRELHERVAAAEEELDRLEKPGAEPGTVGEDGAGGDEDESSDDDEDSERNETLSRLLRLQYGLMTGGAAAMAGMAEVGEEFMRTLAEESDFAENDSPGEVAGRLPDSLISALRAMLNKMEDVPQEMLDSFRRYSED